MLVFFSALKYQRHFSINEMSTKITVIDLIKNLIFQDPEDIPHDVTSAAKSTNPVDDRLSAHSKVIIPNLPFHTKIHLF